MVNRTQALVLGFFVVALASLLVILAVAPELYDQALRLPEGSGVREVAVLAALTAFLGLLALWVLRRWRWTFWLVLAAFLLMAREGPGRAGGPAYRGRHHAGPLILVATAGRPPATVRRHRLSAKPGHPA